MATVTVDVNDKMIDVAVRKELQLLRTQVVRLKAGNRKLQRKIREQQSKFDEAKRIVAIASDIATEFGDIWADRG